MSDLEEAANAAVLGVRALRQRMEAARIACDQSLERVTALADVLASDKEALQGAMEELDKTVEESSQQVADDAAAAESALVDLAGVTKNAGAQAHQALDVETQALKRLAEHLDLVDTQVDVLARSAAEASKAAVERAGAIAASLQEVAAQAQRHLTDCAALIEELAGEVDNAAVAARSLLPDQYQPVFREADQDFAAKTEQMTGVMKALFADMQKHAEEVAEYSLDQFRSFVEEEQTSIREQVQILAIDLEELTRQAATQSREIEAAGGALQQHLGDNVEAAQKAEQALHQVRGRWMLFGFGL